MRVISIVLLSTLALFGCDDDGDTGGAGGMTAAGGMSTAGGASGMGGMPMAGGESGMGGMPTAGGAPGTGGMATNESDCGRFCREVFACDLDDQGTEEECATFCDENPQFFPPRVFECVESHLADGRCEEEPFEQCAKGPVLRFFDQVAGTVCGRVFECCPGGQEGAFFMSRDDCVGLISGIGGGFMNGAELMGYIAFDQALAADCAAQAEAAMAVVECADFPADFGILFAEGLDCDGLFRPLKGEDEDCGLGDGGQGFIPLSEACTEGLFCKAQGAEMPTCRPGSATGDACTAEAPECLGEDECIDGVCVAPAALGEACLAPAQCTTANCTDGICGDAAPLVCAE